METTPNNKKYLTDQELNNILTKEFLVEEYINKKIPYCVIAKEIVKCDPSTVKNKLLKFGIPIRSRSEALTGRKMPPHSEETNLKRSKLAKGKPKPKDFGAKLSKIKLGIKLGPQSEEHKRKRIDKIRGENHYRWKGGITPLGVMIRNSLNYKNWVKEVFQKDNYTCQKCAIRSGNGKTVLLEAHHIKEFSKILKEFLYLYPSLNPLKDKEQLLTLALNYSPFWDITNGKTLCYGCHRDT